MAENIKPGRKKSTRGKGEKSTIKNSKKKKTKGENIVEGTTVDGMDNTVKKLYRSQRDRMIGGVCGGVADYLGLDSTIIRVLWVLFAFVGGSGIIAYIVGLLIIPESPIRVEGEKSTRKRGDATLFWGSALIIVGLLFLLGELNFFPFHFGGHWSSAWSMIWPVFLIALGAWLLMRPGHDQREASSGTEVEDSSTEDDASPRSRLTRSRSDRKLSGVCGGLAEYFSVDSTIVRLFWVLGTLASVGFGVLAYVILIVVLQEKTE